MKNKIDFIGIGVKRCGTTSLSRYLDAHPGVCISVPKELKYFHTSRLRREGEIWNPRSKNSLDWYMKHFGHCKSGQINGEISPDYFLGESAPQRIYENFPNAKIIISVRNPVDRAFSAYRLGKYYSGTTNLNFMECMSTQPNLIEEGLYYKYLNNYLRYYPFEQIHVVLFEDLKNNPVPVMQDLFRFLGVDNTFVPSNIGNKYNRARISRMIWLNKLERYIDYTLPPLGMGSTVKWLKSLKIMEWKRKIQFREVPKESIDPNDRAKLIEYFRDDIVKLSQLINRDLSQWLK